MAARPAPLSYYTGLVDDSRLDLISAINAQRGDAFVKLPDSTVLPELSRYVSKLPTASADWPSGESIKPRDLSPPATVVLSSRPVQLQWNSDQGFSGDTTVQDITLPAGFASGLSAFRCFKDCTSLTTVRSPDDAPFSNATNLFETFYGCTCLTSGFPEQWAGASDFFDDPPNECFFIWGDFARDAHLEHAGSGDLGVVSLFRGCSSLPAVVIDRDASFGQDARSLWGLCYDCSALTRFIATSSSFGGKAVSVGSCFANCSSLVELDLSGTAFGRSASSVTSCFDGCTALRELRLPVGFGQSSTTWQSTSDNKYSCSFIGPSTLTTATGGTFRYTVYLAACESLDTCDFHERLVQVSDGYSAILHSFVVSSSCPYRENVLTDDVVRQYITGKGWTFVEV